MPRYPDIIQAILNDTSPHVTLRRKPIHLFGRGEQPDNKSAVQEGFDWRKFMLYIHLFLFLSHYTAGSNPDIINGQGFTSVVSSTNWPDDSMTKPKGSPYVGIYVIGGVSGDFLGIQQAFDSLAVHGISGMVILRVSPGTYTEQIQIPSIPGSSDTSRVVLISQTGKASDVIVTHASGAQSNYTMRIQASWIEIRDISIQATHVSYGRVIELTGTASHVLIQGCRIFSHPSARTNSQSVGIQAVSNQGNGFQFVANTIYNTYTGILASGQSTLLLMEGLIVEGNVMKDYYKTGIEIVNVLAPVILKNQVESYANAVSVTGIILKYVRLNARIIGNRIKVSGTSNVTGLSLFTCTGGSDTSAALICNNFISVTGTTGTVTGLYLYQSDYQYLYHNSIEINSITSSSVVASFYAGGNNHSFNNLFVNFGGGYVMRVTGNSLLGADYNNLFSTGSVFCSLANSAVGSLTAWQSMTGQEGHSVQVNPGFNATGQLYPSEPSLDNLGVPVSVVPYDIEGVLRDPFTPDMGAVEFNIAKHDAGILAIPSPLTISHSGVDSIVVVFKNSGLDTLYQLSFFYEFNDTVFQGLGWTGSLPPQDTSDPHKIAYLNLSGGEQLVKVWVSLPNAQPDMNAWNDTLIKSFLVCDALNGNYTIGFPGSGSDFSSFADAVDALAQCGIGGPVTFLVMPGAYLEQIRLDEYPGLSAVNTLTIKSFTGDPEDVVIRYTASGSSDNYVVRLNGADYVTIQDMTLKAGQTGTFGNVVELSGGAHFNTITGNIIESIQGANSVHASCISSGNTIDQYNVISGNRIRYGYYGISLSGTSQGLEVGNIITGNQIEASTQTGILYHYGKNLIISNNDYKASGGSSSHYGIRINGCGEGTLVVKNRVQMEFTGTHYGLYISYITALAQDKAVIANNFISMTGTTSHPVLIYVYNAAHVIIAHNSLYCQPAGNTRGIYVTSPPQNASLRIVNNMICNAGGGYTLYFNTSNAQYIAQCDHNNLYTSGSGLAYFGSAFSDLASWQFVTHWDSNSVSLDPLFHSPADLYPYNHSLNDLGLPLPDILDDIYGNLRSISHPDIGAIEFTPALHDAGLAAITQPLAVINPDTNAIIARIRNFGLANLFTTLIHYCLDDGPVYTQPWAGSLVPMQESGDIILGNIFLPHGKYLLKVWTSGPNNQIDGNDLNDTLRRWITVCDMMSGTFTIGGAGSDYPDIMSAVSDLNSCGVGGPVTFQIQPGLYEERIILDEINGVSDSNRIIFQSSSGIAGDVVIAYAAGGSGDNWVWRLNGADYITIKDLTLRSTALSTYGRVLELTNGASHNLITGNIVESIPGSSSSAASCIYSGNSSDHSNVISHNTLRYGYSGIYMSGPSSQYPENGLLLDSNHIEEFTGYGIYLINQVSGSISKNTLRSADQAGTVYGIRLNSCHAGTHVNGNRISLAHVTGTSYGLMLEGGSGTQTQPIRIVNNIIEQVDGSNGNAWSVLLSGASHIRFFHNTVITRSVSSSSYAMRFQSSCDSIEIINNILVNEASGFVFYGSAADINGITFSDHNLFYTPSFNLVYAGFAITDLASWQAFSGFDTGSVFLDPDLLPQQTDPVPGNNSANNLGVFLVDVGKDFFGDERDHLHPDMGAIEFDAIPVEVAHLGIDIPLQGCNMGIAPIGIWIHNRGADTVTGNLLAGYQVEGDSIVHSDTIMNVIFPGDTLYYSFNHLQDFSVIEDSLFKITSWIRMNGDLLPYNDTVVTRLGSLVSPPPPGVVSTSVPYAYPAVLQVVSPDSEQCYYWYDQPFSMQAFDTGSVIQTPLLFDSSVFYVDAMYAPLFDTIAVGSGTATSSQIPVAAASAYSWSHCLYRSQEIQAGGIIEAISYYVASPTVNYYQDNQRIYVTHTPDTVIGTLYPSRSGWTMVYDGPVSWNGPGWNTITFDQPFLYNKTENLSILFENHQGMSPGAGYPVFGVTQTSAGLSVSASSPLFFPGFAGSHGSVRPNIRLIGGPNACRSQRTEDTVLVHPQQVFLSAGNDRIICSGDSVLLTVGVSGGVPPYVYEWSPVFYLSHPFAQQTSCFAPVSTLYTITVTDQFGERDIDDILITVAPLPVVSITAISGVTVFSPPIILTNGSPAGGIYDGPGVTGGVFFPSVAGGGYHIITYTYADSLTGCLNMDTTLQFVDPLTGIDGHEAWRVEVAPNPARDFVTIRFSAGYYDVVELTNTLGELIWKGHISSDMEFLEMDTRNHAPGLYFLRISGKHGNSTVMIMFQ